MPIQQMIDYYKNRNIWLHKD